MTNTPKKPIKRVRLKGNVDEKLDRPDPRTVREKQNLNLTRKKYKGRPPGFPNKIPRTVKEMFIEAANMHPGGGARYLYNISITHPKLFVGALAKLLPQNVKIDADPASAMGQLLQAVNARMQAERNRVLNGTVVDVKAISPPKE